VRIAPTTEAKNSRERVKKGPPRTTKQRLHSRATKCRPGTRLGLVSNQGPRHIASATASPCRTNYIVKVSVKYSKSNNASKRDNSICSAESKRRKSIYNLCISVEMSKVLFVVASERKHIRTIHL
jgi:hypothetical protein